MKTDLTLRSLSDEFEDSDENRIVMSLNVCVLAVILEDEIKYCMKKPDATSHVSHICRSWHLLHAILFLAAFIHDHTETLACDFGC
ncbi:hypothetical protein KIN20_010083 [Parelaphostrongylus tenuis]|uniref:Uncharacterized protein n=1 Tax=Parelaphostrongylus tenuis TaxID=148309 RepID=A0AAD5MRF1_PARTN|nr:hypothetical protein KIN20_010083 [Parelaphostrongylus tenuis]